MVNHLLSRRRFLHAGATGIGLGLASSITRPLHAATLLAPRPGDAVGGPFADAYLRYAQPRGLTLSLPESKWARERVVRWLTSGDMQGPDRSSRVEFGVVPPNASPAAIAGGDFLTGSSGASSRFVPRGAFDEDNATVKPIPGDVPVRAHTAALRGLRPGSRVSYRVGSDAGWSEVKIFDIGDRSSGFRFTHFGDHGTTVASRRNTAAVLAREPSFHVIAGDISYANGHQPTWDLWANQVEPLTSAVPLVAGAGNHEAKDFYGATYRARFAHPKPARHWFSFDYQNVHVLSWTAGAFLTEHDPSSATQLVREEMLGMEQDLAVAAARRAAGEIDFIVVLQHFPLYTNHRTRGPFSPQYVVAEEHILQRYQVDLVLVGHDHMYQRSFPSIFGTPTTRAQSGLGYVQVNAGGGGVSIYEFTPADFGEIGSDPDNPFMQWGSWLAAWAREYSFVEYDVTDNQITGRAFGWADVPNQNRVPQDPATYEDDLVPVDPDAVNPSLAAREIDRFVIKRKPKAILEAAAKPPRLLKTILRGVPEARGIVVRNHAEDCTRHTHYRPKPSGGSSSGTV